MDKSNPNEHGENWLDEILDAPDLSEELGPDENAVSSAGLTHPEDVELERIIQETKELQQEENIDLQQTRQITGLEDIYTASQKTPDLDAQFAQAQPDSDPYAQYDEEEYTDDGNYDEEYADDGYFDEDADAEEEEEPARPRILFRRRKLREQKGRPYPKKGYGLFGLPHIAATLIWLVITVSIGVSFGRIVWLCAADMLAFGKTSEEISFTVTNSDNIDTIASKLKNAGLIKYPELFKFFVEIKGDEDEIISGTFTLNTLYDYNALVNALKPQSPARQEIEVLVPEGYNCAQIFALLESKGVCTAEALKEHAANGELNDYWFLEGVTRGTEYCLEGYLFPNTYRFYINDEPRRVLQKFLNSFDDNFTELMRERIATIQETFAQMMRKNGYGQDYIDAHKLTLHQIVTIASIVEKESANSTESYTVASVFLNRLANQRNYPYLQSDATIYYALGDVERDELTAEDLAIDSPYNTYKYAGLIPGPISNPGQASLNAVLDPDETNYYFFFYDSSAGVHRFATNLAEHNANIKKYGK